MKRHYQFPIVEVSGHKLTSIEGSLSFFYEIRPIDLEQKDEKEVGLVFDALSRSLNHLSSECFFKFYRLEGRSYLQTNFEGDISIAGLEIILCENPLQVFFGDNLLFSDIGIYDDYLSYNGEYIRLFSVKNFSEDEAFPEIIPHDIDYVLSFKRKEKIKSISKLDRIRTGHLSSFFKNKRDLSSEGTYSQAEDLIHDIIHGEEELFDMTLFFLCRGNSLNELRVNSNLLINHMNTLGVTLFLEGQSLIHFKSGLTTIFNELIPGGVPTFKLRGIPNKTSHLRFLLPISESHLSNEGIKLSDTNDNQIFFNPFDKTIKNRNMLVTGLSGGGKSVFVNKIVHSLIDDHPTVILDKGGSFKKLTLYHGGEVLSQGFNPLQFKCPYYLREFVLSMMDGEKVSKLDRGRLLKCIKENLSECDSFDELIEFLKKDFHQIDLYFEEHRDFLRGATLSDIPILYVDIEEYPKGIITPLIIFLLEYFKNLGAKEKILVFDECWSFLGAHAAYIDECFRTFRKTGAFPIAISQSLRDFEILGRELASSITNNSYFKVFFPQELQESLEISSFDINRVQNLQFEKNNFSECFLKTSDNRYRKILRVGLSPLELELFNTEAGRDISLYQFRDRFSDFFKSDRELINSYIRLKYDENTQYSDDSSFNFFDSGEYILDA